VCVCQEERDQQWKRAMDYLSAVSELNYMTQIVIMLYEDNTKVSVRLEMQKIRKRKNVRFPTSPRFPLKDITSEERFHVELHFSPGVKGVEEEENAPTGFGFRPASAEVARQVEPRPRGSFSSRVRPARSLSLSLRSHRSRRTPAAWRTSRGTRRTAPCRCLNPSPFRSGPRSYATIRPDPWR